MESKRYNIYLLRIIRIALDGLSIKEFSEQFGVTAPYMTQLENGQKCISDKTLNNGLERLGISQETYQELYHYHEQILSTNYEPEEQFQSMLMKALVVLHPESCPMTPSLEKTLKVKRKRKRNSKNIEKKL